MMKRKFLSAVFSITLAACLFSNTVFASELGNTESPGDRCGDRGEPAGE